MRLFLFVVGLVLLFTACAPESIVVAKKFDPRAPTPAPIGAPATNLTSVISSNQIRPEWLRPSTEPYRLGPGDRIELELLGRTGTRTTTFVCADGKVYFDLLEQRRTDGLTNVALIRLEQLYPFPTEGYEAVLERYANAHEIVWCQEEPQNQGAWYQIRHRLQERLSNRDAVFYAGRPSAAAPATGIHQLHVEQQQRLVRAALHAVATAESSREPPRLKPRNESTVKHKVLRKPS